MNALTTLISRSLEIVLTLLLAALAVVTALELTIWLALGRSFSEVEEIQGLLMIWFAFLGAAYCLAEKQHLLLGLVVSRLPRGWQRQLGRLAAALVAVFGALLAFYGARLVAAVDNTLPATGWSASLQYVPAIVAGALILLFALDQVLRAEDVGAGA